MLTYAQIQDPSSGIERIAGVCSTSDQFGDFVNEACRRLLDYGNWWGSVVKFQGCIYNGCVTWPRQVETVLATNICGLPRPVVGGWFEFLQLNGGDIGRSRGGNIGWDWGWGNGWNGGWNGQARVVENDGTTPVFNQPPCGSAFYPRFYPRCQNDIGKTITVYGVDGNGQEFRTLDANNNWIRGQVLTLALPFVSASSALRKITQVVKDQTQCVVDGFWYDATNNAVWDMAHYQPTETNPNYEHSVISHFHVCKNTDGTTKPRTLLAFVKLRHIDMVLPNDITPLCSLGAIKLMVQSIKKEDQYNEESLALQASAIKELNRELRNKIPLEQVPVTVESFGTAVPARAMIGRIL